MNPDSDDSICSRITVKVKNTIQFFGDMSSLHGVGYIFSMSPISVFKRLFWLIVLVCCCLGASAVLQGALSLYSGDLVSYSVETNYLNFDTPFPAVTICEQMDSGERVKPYLTKNGLPVGLTTFLKENVYWSLKYCRACLSCKINQTCAENFREMVDGIRLNCSGILTDCWWNNKRFHCCDRFHPISTEYGTCFAFNSRFAGNNVSTILTLNQRSGLPALIFTAIQTVQIRIHSPDDLVSASMENILGLRSSSLPLVTDFEAILKAEQVISDSSVDPLTPSRRGCLFKHEQPARAHLWPFNEYTYNACLLYCKANAQVELCNCTHHFMPLIGQSPACDITGLACLHNYKDNLRDLNCECPMGCEEISYEVIHIRNFRHVDNVPKELVKRGTRAIIRLGHLPALRVLRRCIRDMLGLVVDVGGVGGVFFGASLLSVIEIVYLFFIRRGP